jgi:hypothetical protein
MKERIFVVLSEQLEYAVWVSHRHHLITDVFFLVAFPFSEVSSQLINLSCFNLYNYHTNEKVTGS